PVLVVLATQTAGLAWWKLRSSDLCAWKVAVQFRDAYRFQTLQAAVQEREIVRVFERLRAAGVEPLLVKGWAAARLYPERGLRPYGDIDLAVAPRQLHTAEAALREPGIPQASVELHAGYAKLPGRTFEELIDGSQRVCLNGVLVRIPGPEDHLRLLCLHMLAHGAWRPLWLCDIAAGVEARPAGFDWERCLGGRRPYSGWVACALGLASELVGASLEGAPI